MKNYKHDCSYANQQDYDWTTTQTIVSHMVVDSGACIPFSVVDAIDMCVKDTLVVCEADVCKMMN